MTRPRPNSIGAGLLGAALLVWAGIAIVAWFDAPRSSTLAEIDARLADVEIEIGVAALSIDPLEARVADLERVMKRERGRVDALEATAEANATAARGGRAASRRPRHRTSKTPAPLPPASSYIRF